MENQEHTAKELEKRVKALLQRTLDNTEPISERIQPPYFNYPDEPGMAIFPASDPEGRAHWIGENIAFGKELAARYLNRRFEVQIMWEPEGEAVIPCCLDDFEDWRKKLQEFKFEHPRIKKAPDKQ